MTRPIADFATQLQSDANRHRDSAVRALKNVIVDAETALQNINADAENPFVSSTVGGAVLNAQRWQDAERALVRFWDAAGYAANAEQLIQAEALTARKAERKATARIKDGAIVKVAQVDLNGLQGRDPHPPADLEGALGVVQNLAEVITDEPGPSEPPREDMNIFLYSVDFPALGANYLMAEYEIEVQG